MSIRVYMSYAIQLRPLNNYVLERFYSREFGEALVIKYDYSEVSINHYMKKYNSRRLHSAIGNRTPDEVYYEGVNNIDHKGSNLLRKVS
jgi:transposase InsO family protein